MGKHLGVAYNLRLPAELKDKIAESAQQLNRSMNADIVARLEESFSEKKEKENLSALLVDALEQDKLKNRLLVCQDNLIDAKQELIRLHNILLANGIKI